MRFMWFRKVRDLMARFDKLLCSSNCTDLFNCRTKEEMYRHLSIEVEEPIANEKGDREEPAEVKWSVQNGLKKFFAPEKRDVICEHCKIGTTATQTLAVMNR